MAVSPAPIRLSAADETTLAAMVAQHRSVQSRLSVPDRAILDQMTALVKRQLFAAPLRGDLLTATTRVVSAAIPGLSAPEAASLAQYALGEIASDTVTAAQGEAAMSFNMQYLTLQEKMQNENRQYAAVSNVLKTKHDTVKNSIGNIR
jgi:hypothetical protein